MEEKRIEHVPLPLNEEEKFEADFVRGMFLLTKKVTLDEFKKLYGQPLAPPPGDA